MKKYLIVTADTNDGDYIMEKTEVSDEIIKKIEPVIEAIKNFEPYVGTKPDYWDHKHNHNFPEWECVREDLGEKSSKELYGHLEGFEDFRELCPYGEYGIHTIDSIELIIVKEEKRLL